MKRRTSKEEKYLRRTVRLCPTKKQARLMCSYAGASRWAFNEALAWSGKVYRLLHMTVTPKMLRVHLRNLRDGFLGYEWLKSIPVCITNHAIEDFVEARKRFFKGEEGFPKFKAKRNTRPSFYLRMDTVRIVDENHIKLTGFKDPIRHKGYKFPPKLLDIHIYFNGKYWMISFSEKVSINKEVLEDNILGIDVGINALVTTSDGDVYRNINQTKEVKKIEKRLKRKKRKLSRKYLMNKNKPKTKNILKLEKQVARLHKKLSDIRKTYNHEVSKNIVERFPKAIVMEDLNIKDMLKDKHLARDIQNASLYDLMSKIIYKAEMKGIPVIKVDRFYPSSKTCSNCGHIKKDLKLKDRIFICDSCGLIIDRDLNAAINMKNKGKELLEL